ncbi:hypothetical protein CDAR_402211 [Caerostris darwini]|uniref:Uncharacterized protein n=1 Tax=Caerostris darwini TaxID=1538125 RepID=A0AAV4T348_9ARAC|nr:hypothetical protein CDAR_402211 [Caerostris darwini]
MVYSKHNFKDFTVKLGIILLCGVKDLEANAIGLSWPSTMCERKPERPIGLASHVSIIRSVGSYGVRILSLSISIFTKLVSHSCLSEFRVLSKELSMRINS